MSTDDLGFAIDHAILDATPVSLLAVAVPVAETIERQWFPGTATAAAAAVVLGVVAVLILIWYVTTRARTPLLARIGLALMRMAALGVLAWMLFGWYFDRRATDRPSVVVALDVSESMATPDGVARPETAPEAGTPPTEVAGPTRLDVARRVLLGQLPTADQPAQAGLLARLRQAYRVEVNLIGGSVRPWRGDGPDAGPTRELDSDQLDSDRVRSQGSASEVVEAGQLVWAATDPASRLAEQVAQLIEARRGRETTAMIVLTDGIVTDGMAWDDLVPIAREHQTPIIVVGIGTDRARQELKISRVSAEPVIDRGDNLTVETALRATGLAGRSVRVVARRGDASGRSGDGRPGLDGADGATGMTGPTDAGPVEPGEVLAEQRLTFVSDDEDQTVRLTFRPDAAGEFPYHIAVEPVEPTAGGADPVPGSSWPGASGREATPNLVRESSVFVRDDVLNVLLVQGGPSWEFRHLKTLLERSLRPDGVERAFDLTTVLQDADLDYVETDATARQLPPSGGNTLAAFDVVILSDVDPDLLGTAWMEQLRGFVLDQGGGLVLLPGPDHPPRRLANTPLATLLPYEPRTASIPAGDGRGGVSAVPTSIGLTLPAFQQGDLSGQAMARWRRLPPLRWTLRSVEPRPAARVLLESGETGPDGRPLPLVMMQFAGAGQVLAHTTDETWIWRSEADAAAYEAYWLDILRYVSRGRRTTGTGRVELTTDREVVALGQPVTMTARWLDAPEAPASDDGVVVLVESEASPDRPIRLTREAADRGVFTAEITGLPPGTYRGTLAVPVIEPTRPAVSFEVEPPPGERSRQAVPRRTLERIARATEGRYVPPERAEEIFDALPLGETVPVRSLEPESYWNRWPFVVLVLGLLIGEWTLRRLLGLD